MQMQQQPQMLLSRLLIPAPLWCCQWRCHSHHHHPTLLLLMMLLLWKAAAGTADLLPGSLLERMYGRWDCNLRHKHDSMDSNDESTG